MKRQALEPEFEGHSAYLRIVYIHPNIRQKQIKTKN